MSNVASFVDVSIKRGRANVFEGLNLNLQSGQIIGLLGPSGAGKTTIMRALVGVQSGVSGSVTVLGQPAGAEIVATRVAYSTQASSVFDDLSIVENLNFARKILDAPKIRVAEVIAEVGLGGLEKRRVGSLSGGQRNRVSLAMAMLGQPELLVLDEPTVGLDPVLRAEIWAIFRALAGQGRTIVVSSHVMDEAERCDSLIFVRDGKIIAQDTLPNIMLATNTTSAETAFLKLAKVGA